MTKAIGKVGYTVAMAFDRSRSSNPGRVFLGERIAGTNKDAQGERGGKLVDPRGPRFNQAVVCAIVLVGFGAGVYATVPAVAVILALGVVFGPRYAPFIRLYSDLVRPRLGPPGYLEDPRPPRFASVLGTVFLLAATTALYSGESAIGWGLALVVAALAGLAAASGVCIGCKAYVALVRLRGGSMSARQDVAGGAERGAEGARLPRLPLEISSGAARTWVVFTSPYCGRCAPLVDAIRSKDSQGHLVTLDVGSHISLARLYNVSTLPTVLLASQDGAVVRVLRGGGAEGDLDSMLNALDRESPEVAGLVARL